MAITIPKFGIAQNNSGNTVTASWSGGGSSAAGSIIVCAGFFDNAGNFSALAAVGGAGGVVTDSGIGVHNHAGAGIESFVKAFLSPASGITGVTLTTTGGAFYELAIWEIAGFSIGIFDKATENDANPPQATPTGTLSASAEAAIAYMCTDSGIAAFAAGNGWTTDTPGGSAFGSMAGHQVVSSNASLTASATDTVQSSTWIATFMEGTPPPTSRNLMPQIIM